MEFPERPYDTEVLRRWVSDAVAARHPRWRLYGEMSAALDRECEVEEMTALTQVMAEIERLLVDRNLKGRDHEKEGRDDLAVELYEANLSDGFDASHPYDRLRRIYRRRSDLIGLIRVEEAYRRLANADPLLCDQLRKDIAALRAETGSSGDAN